jgi:hypothetical protein
MRTLVLSGIVFAASIAVVVPPRPAHAQGCVTMALGACKVRLRFRQFAGGLDKFVAKCDGMTLGAGSDGIAPVLESVTFSLSSAAGPCFSHTLAPGDILRRGLHGGYYYNTPVKGSPGLRRLRLKARSAGQWHLRATANAADLQCLGGPPIIGLTIGDDCGSVSCTERKPTLYDCP